MAMQSPFLITDYIFPLQLLSPLDINDAIIKKLQTDSLQDHVNYNKLYIINDYLYHSF